MANRVIGAIAGDLVRAPAASGESTLGDVLADAQLDGTSASAGAVIAFMNPGGIRADLLRATVSAGEQPGEITYAEAFAVQPFGNNLVTMSLTGAQIEQLLEQQWAMAGTTERQMILQVSHGFSYAWDPTRPLGDRIDAATLTLDGAPIDPSAIYRVTMNSFLADGGDGFTVFRAGTDRVAGPVDLDPLAAYLTAHAPLAVPTLGRIVRR
jgi:5'-nucleotidase